MNKISERNKTNVLSIKDLFEIYKKDDKIIAFIKIFPHADTCWVLRIKNNSTNINIVESLSTYKKVDYIIKEVNGWENIKKVIYQELIISLNICLIFVLMLWL